MVCASTFTMLGSIFLEKGYIIFAWLFDGFCGGFFILSDAHFHFWPCMARQYQVCLRTAFLPMHTLPTAFGLVLFFGWNCYSNTPEIVRFLRFNTYLIEACRSLCSFAHF
jgi:hypothetical protein